MSGHGNETGGRHEWETSDAEVKPLLWLAAGLTLMCVVTFILCEIFINVMEAERVDDEGLNHPMMEYAETPTAPLLQDGETRETDLAEYRAKMAEATSTYGWIEPTQGIVRLPLQRAAELMLKEKKFSHRSETQQ